MVETYFATHPAEQERYSQYAEQRGALRAAFTVQPAGPMPTRLRVAYLLTEQPRRRRQRLGRIAAAVALLLLGGAAGWTARDVLPGLASSASAVLSSTVFDKA